MKELPSISWQVEESVYRTDPSLSYSTLAKFEREGYDNLAHLFDRVESPALTQGSMVDTLITGSVEEFNELFFIADFPSVGEKETQIANSLFNNFSQNFRSFADIPFNEILYAANIFEFQKNWRDDTRVKVLTERCSQYYDLKYQAGSRTIVDERTYQKVIAMVRALKTSVSTLNYFADNRPEEDVKRYYQLKFKSTFNNVDYRCMADLIIVFYEDKVIIPIDLKTSGKREWHFEDSFEQWMYMVQARLYWRIIRDNLDRDSYFKDFTLENYRFIVVNKESLTPLVWEFPLTKEMGTLVDNKGNKFRDPFEIGQELRKYLDNKPEVPEGIDQYGINTINCLHKLEENDNNKEEWK